jgi:hypothetical protein
MTPPPPIDNLTMITSDRKFECEWLVQPGADYFEIKFFKTNSGLVTADMEPLSHFTEHKVGFPQSLQFSKLIQKSSNFCKFESNLD